MSSTENQLNTARNSASNNRLSTAPNSAGLLTSRSHMPEGPFYNPSSSYVGIKTPRDRVLTTSRGSVFQFDRTDAKLPPPPIGRTMGHGVLKK
jgi:hypothetical protein